VQFGFCFVLVIAAVFFSAMIALADSGRNPLPTPPGGGSGVKTYAPDQLSFSGERIRRREPDGPIQSVLRSGRDPQRSEVGGDDVLITEYGTVHNRDLAIASDGTLYAVTPIDNGSEQAVAVFRSIDGGSTWTIWAQIGADTPGYRCWQPVIHIAEGVEDRCFVAYALDPNAGGTSEMHVAWSPLDVPEGDFSADTAIYSDDLGVHHPSLTSDAGSFSAYFVYLSFQRDWGESDIFFCRSTTQGTSFEDAYAIGEISLTDRGYYKPEVRYGYDTYVHVIWTLEFEDGHEYDAAVRYRRVPNYAGGGLANWDFIQALSPHNNGVHELRSTLGASTISPDVIVNYERRLPSGRDGAGSISSSDSGDNFSSETIIAEDSVLPGNIIHQPTTDRWLFGAYHYGHASGFSWGYYWASVASPDSWSTLVNLSDDNHQVGMPVLALDPSRDHQIAMVNYTIRESRWRLAFDAE